MSRASDLREYIDKLVNEESHQMRRQLIVPSALYSLVVLFFLWLESPRLQWQTIAVIGFFTAAALICQLMLWRGSLPAAQQRLREEIMERELTAKEIRLIKGIHEKPKFVLYDDAPINETHAMIRRFIAYKRQMAIRRRRRHIVKHKPVERTITIDPTTTVDYPLERLSRR